MRVADPVFVAEIGVFEDGYSFVRVGTVIDVADGTVVAVFVVVEFAA